ncbi:MAG: 50S ribosomal protein L25 [bacterium]|nr:50S ribosomal protein L25 [bacterium]
MAFQLHVKTREKKGRQVRAFRREGGLPGIVYGDDMEPTPVEIDVSEFRKVYRDAGSSSLIDVTLNDTEPFKVLIQEVQVHLLHMHPTHVDLFRIKMGEEFEVDVPLHFIGESGAVKNMSGTLERNVKEVTVRCLPAKLPSHIDVDLSKLATFEDVITLADLVVPEGVTIDLDPEAQIASVSAPISEEQMKKMEEEGQADVTSVVVEGEKKEGEEAGEADNKDKKEESSESK